MKLIDKLKTKVFASRAKAIPEAQPLLITTEAGQDIRVFFGGLCYVYDKLLHNALIEYQITEEKIVKKDVLIEPVTREHNDGTIEDKTEKYFKQILDSANMSEDKEKYKALTYFFGMNEIDEKEMKSNYIGILSEYENGTYYRFFDDEFRIKYVREKLEGKYLDN